jgi:stage III sporulation protein AB
MYCLKIIEIIFIIILCSILGILKANTFSKRVIELKNIKSALNIFKSKIQFTFEPISEIFTEISNSVYLNEENIFNTTNFILNSNQEKYINLAWNKAINITKNSLNNEDKEILKMLSSNLGKSDKSGQISSIDVIDKFINTQIEQAEIEKLKNTKLYKTLGTVIGCTIGILLF